MALAASAWEVRTLCRDGQLKHALHILDSIGQRGSQTYPDVYMFLLQKCINIKSLAEGKCVHAHIIKSGFKPNIFIESNLVNMYLKCGSVMDARKVFNKICKRDVVLWTVMITGYARYGLFEEALTLLCQMQGEGEMADKVLFISLLKACSHHAALEQGKQIHVHIIETGLELNAFVRSAILDMYIKCGSLEHAQQVFDKMTDRDVVTWTMIIAGYARHGRGEEALKLFQQMQKENVKPDNITFGSVVKACACFKALEQAKMIHAHIIKGGFQSDIVVGNTLVDMYGKCRNIDYARMVFDKMIKRDAVTWTAMVAGYVQHGDFEKALKLFQQMPWETLKPDKVIFMNLLNACCSPETLRQGKQIHCLVIENGFELDALVASALVDMYAKCGSIGNARQVFDTMPKRDVVSWTTMIAGYVQYGHAKEALKIFEQMQQGCVKANKATFVSVLKACAGLVALEPGKHIHAHIIKGRFDLDVVVGNTLVDMYSKCGSIDLALQVFNKISERDVISWNAMIGGYAQHGHGEKALNLFWKMLMESMKPDKVTFINILKACTSISSLEQGKQIHAQIIKSGLESDVFVASTLIDMYAKCGGIVHAHQVFNKMPERDVVSWNAMILGNAQHGNANEALHLFQQMKRTSLKPDKVTFVSVLKASSCLAELEQGKQIHAEIIKSGFESDTFVGNILVDMYAKCGSIEHAQQVFNKMPKRDVVSWTVIIGAYVQHGCNEEALNLFWQMQLQGMEPDKVTFTSALNACSSLTAFEQGKKIHTQIIKSGFELHDMIGNALVDMYAKCGNIEHARLAFDKIPKRDVVSWTVMIAGYVQHGQSEEVLKLFWLMQQHNVELDRVTIVKIVNACAKLFSLEHGKQIHAHIIKCGFELDVFVASSLVDMYAKCGSIDLAHQLFDMVPKRDVVLWTAMIMGYAQHGHAKEALELFWQMRWDNVEPNEVTFVTILKVCASIAALEQGRLIFSQIIESGCKLDAFMGNALVDMYAKCGSIDEACQVFDNMPKRDVVSWNVMIAAYSQHGQGKEALQLFQRMRQEGTEMDHITFIGVLSACSHSGLVDEGCYYFDSMNHDHCITPVAEHYTCMVDLLGRAGHLEEAENFINRMPCQPMVMVWMALLGACKIHGHVELAKHATKWILELEPQNTAAYVLLSNTYSASSNWDERAKLIKMLQDRCEKRTAVQFH